MLAMFDFTNQIAVVTGASGALGGVLARQLRTAGATLVLPARDPQKLEKQLAGAAPGAGGIHTLRCEITEPDSVATFARTLADRFGGADILVNVAGGFRGGAAVAQTTVAVWDEMLAVNARSAFLVSRALLPGMLARGGGRIVNVASRAAEKGGAGVAAYSAAKAAVVRLTESLAAETAAAGLRVNCVLPGTIDTAANRAAMPDAERSGWVEPEALADAILFLLSPLARAVHGAALPVYGIG
jgi:NAD(P)-dependent dehydrogenase (short-subunit alcohol dehydrogenase family)